MFSITSLYGITQTERPLWHLEILGLELTVIDGCLRILVVLYLIDCGMIGYQEQRRLEIPMLGMGVYDSLPTCMTPLISVWSGIKDNGVKGST